MKKTALISIAAILAGCVSTTALNRAMSYPSTSTAVKMPDDNYRVFEHKTDSTLMTTPSLGKAMGPGIVRGATLGMAGPATPIDGHRAAARQYLDTTGRANCEIVSGYVLADPQYEFMFKCP